MLSSYKFWENWGTNRSLCCCPAKGRTDKLSSPLTPMNTQKDVLESRSDSRRCLWHCWLLLPLLCDAPRCSSNIFWDPVLQDTSCSWPLAPALLGLAFKDTLPLPRAWGQLWIHSSESVVFLSEEAAVPENLNWLSKRTFPPHCLQCLKPSQVNLFS